MFCLLTYGLDIDVHNVYNIGVFKVYYSNQALRELKKLDGSIRKTVRKAVDELKDFPNVSNLKPMKGLGLGAWRSRVQDWRIIFFVDDDRGEITVMKIGHRRDVYGDI